MSSLDFEENNVHENHTDNDDYLNDLEELLADNLAYHVEQEETDEWVKMMNLTVGSSHIT